MQDDIPTRAPLDEPDGTQAKLHPILARRRTGRSFSSQLVEPEVLRVLLEAARWAPSSMNAQPWSFLLATRQNEGEFSRLLGCLLDFNVVWAKQAPVLLLAAAQSTPSTSGERNPHALYDVGQAVAALTYQAMASGLQVCQMAGFDGQKARSVYSIPENHEPVVVLAIGYPGDPAVLPEKVRRKETAPRTRNPLRQFVFEVRWGQPARLVGS